MRHGKKINHLGRKTAHRHALLSNMASSLILNKRITTTVAKAKALRKYVEPLITKSKDDTTHSRRVVMSYLQNKESLKSLFGEVASRVTDRKGGYTRIIKLGEARLGDGSEMCFMELVDFNDIYKKDSAAKKAKTRRGKKGKKVEGEVEAAASESPKAEAKEGKPKKAKAKKGKE
jgi:large subunit ribosomal protein L17